MNKKKAIAHFRQLCCLGLPHESIGPAILEALHQVVPSLHNRVAWCDEQHNVSSIDCENAEGYLYGRLFIEQYNNRLSYFPGTDFIVRQPRGAGHYHP